MSESQNDVGGAEDRGLISQVGPMQVDWPRSMGYFGGIAVALAFDVINPPMALFIASIPFLKMLNRPGAAKPVRIVSQFFDGMAKPVGGDGTSTVKLSDSEPTKPKRQESGRRTRTRPASSPARVTSEEALAAPEAPTETAARAPAAARTRRPRRSRTTTQ